MSTLDEHRHSLPILETAISRGAFPLVMQIEGFQDRAQTLASWFAEYGGYRSPDFC